MLQGDQVTFAVQAFEYYNARPPYSVRVEEVQASPLGIEGWYARHLLDLQQQTSPATTLPEVDPTWGPGWAPPPNFTLTHLHVRVGPLV